MPTKKALLTLLIIIAPILSIAQEPNASIYFGKDYFLLEGTDIADSMKESPYDRLPIGYKETVQKAVWSLSKAASS